MFFQLFYIVIVILWIRNDFYLLSKHRRNLHNVSKTFYARYVSLFFIFFSEIIYLCVTLMNGEFKTIH